MISAIALAAFTQLFGSTSGAGTEATHFGSRDPRVRYLDGGGGPYGWGAFLTVPANLVRVIPSSRMRSALIDSPKPTPCAL